MDNNEELQPEETNAIPFKARILSNNRFDKAFEKALDECIEELQSTDFEEDKLFPKQAKNRKIQKEDLRNHFNYPELYTHIAQAIQVIFTEGARFLGQKEHADVCRNFSEAQSILDQLNLEIIPNENFGEILKIDQKTSEALFKMASVKIEMQEYGPALSLFIFLTFLYPENFDYWYRMGLIAQKLENYPLALHAYAASIYFNEDLTLARIFSAECYLMLGQRQDALAEYEEAKKASSSLGANKKLSVFLERLEQRIRGY